MTSSSEKAGKKVPLEYNFFSVIDAVCGILIICYIINRYSSDWELTLLPFVGLVQNLVQNEYTHTHSLIKKKILEKIKNSQSHPQLG